MSLTNLIFWSASVVTALTGIQKIDYIQRSILKAQARLVYESRTETWGSPSFLSPKGKEGRHVLKVQK